MRIVIHAGIHKTGTSAVQEYFFSHPPAGIAYPSWGDPNHCGLFVILFQDESRLAEYHGFRARGAEFIARLPIRRENELTRLTAFLDENSDQTVLISAEDISAPEFHPAVQRMYDFLQRWTTDIEVVVYTRGALNFALSAFQQTLKDGGLSSLVLDSLWPYYRDRIGGLDAIFGEERVRVRVYERDALVGGDIVSDLAHVLGVSLDAIPHQRTNVSLSAEATAVLYLQRRMGLGFISGFGQAQTANNRFIEKLSQLGHHRLGFSDALWKPVADKHEEDAAWMAARLGQALSAHDAPAGERVIEIGSEEDLIGLALQQVPALEKMLADELGREPVDLVERTVRTLELLRVLSSLG